jgi:hypothetical protein
MEGGPTRPRGNGAIVPGGKTQGADQNESLLCCRPEPSKFEGSSHAS